jgi:hypothetical protein
MAVQTIWVDFREVNMLIDDLLSFRFEIKSLIDDLLNLIAELANLVFEVIYPYQ